ncbi:MAG: urease accessory protein UreD [Leifsonia sp.]
MSATVIEIAPGARRAFVTLRAGTIVPRLISKGQSSARVALVAGGALLLGGDTIDIRVTVAAGCALELEDVGGTVAYDGEGRQAAWDATVHLGDGSSITWESLPFIVADGADVERCTDINLGADATAVIRETVVLGRAGERGGRVRMRTRVQSGGDPIVVEEIVIDGQLPVPGVLGSARVLDTVIVVGRDLPDSLPFRSVGGSTQLLRLEAGGAVVRSIGDAAHSVDLAPVMEALAFPSQVREPIERAYAITS